MDIRLGQYGRVQHLQFVMSRGCLDVLTASDPEFAIIIIHLNKGSRLSRGATSAAGSIEGKQKPLYGIGRRTRDLLREKSKGYVLVSFNLLQA